MTKPSDFIVSTDYLSIAEFDARTFNLTIPAGPVPYEHTFDFTAPKQYGTIDRIQLTINGVTAIGSTISVSLGDTYGIIQVYRTSATNVQVYVYIYGPSGGGSIPTSTVSIKLNNFRPPNIL